MARLNILPLVPHVQHNILTKYHFLSQFEARRTEETTRKKLTILKIKITSCFLAMQYWLKLSVLVD